jgi:hypothetical protein
MQQMLAAVSAAGVTYATLDPATKGTTAALSNGNLTLGNSNATAGTYVSALSTISKTYAGGAGGKWQCETTVNASADGIIGYATTGFNVNAQAGADAFSVGYTPYSGQIISSGGLVTTVATAAAGDKITVTFDFSVGTISFWKNGSFLFSPTTGATTGAWYAVSSVYANGGGGSLMTTNFGASALSYPIAGFNAGLY